MANEQEEDDLGAILQDLTERIVRGDPSLEEIHLAPRGPDQAPLPPPPPPPRYNLRSRVGRRRPPPLLDQHQREQALDGRVRSLVAAIRHHASGCWSVRAFYMAESALGESFYPFLGEARILAQVRRFPNLREIVLLEKPRSVRGGWPFPHLLLDHAIHYTCWPRIERVVLGGSLHVRHAHDVGRFDALRRATNLEEFAADRLDVPRPEVFFGNFHMVETLVALPSLKTLRLGLLSPSTVPVLAEGAVRALARAPALQALKLKNFGFDDGCVDAFCQELSRNNASTRLSRVELDDFLPRITRAGCVSLLKLLQTENRCLVHVDIHCWDSDEADEEPPLKVLERELEAMCRLNEEGIDSVLANPRATRRDWIRLLESATASLGATFWLLQKCPGLLRDLTAPQPASDGGTTDSKPTANVRRAKRRRLR